MLIRTVFAQTFFIILPSPMNLMRFLVFRASYIGYKEFDPYFSALEKAVASNEPTGTP